MFGTLTEEKSVNWEDPFKKERSATNEIPDVRFARVGPEIDGCQALAVRVKNKVYTKVYTCPIWSTLRIPISHKDGFVFFVWHRTYEDTQNASQSNANYYAVVFHPDGTVEEFESTPELRVIGGKMFSVRPEHWNDQTRKTTKLGDRVVAVWDGIEGPSMCEIPFIMDSRGTPVYLGRKDGKYWIDPESTKVVIRHPKTVLMERKTGFWWMISKTPRADPPEKTVYDMGHHLEVLTDGSVIWGTKEGNLIKIFRDEKEILAGDLIACYYQKKGGLTVIERLPKNRRRIHKIGERRLT